MTAPDTTAAEPVVTNGPIVFTQDLPHGDRQQTAIRAIDADGTNVRTILAGAWQPVWSPDGTQIAFSDFPNGVTQVFVMNADGSDVRQLTHLPHGAEHPAWSPDGTRLAYVAYDANVFTSIWTVRAVDGEDPHEIVPARHEDGTPTMAWSPAWAADGRIAFSGIAPSGGPIADAIFTVQSDGTGMKRVTSGTGEFSPDWSPDSQWLAFERSHGSEATTLHVIRHDGTEERLLVDLAGMALGPVWAPDGSKIAFGMAGAGGDAGPTGGLWTVEADGSNLHQLHEDGASPSWARARR